MPHAVFLAAITVATGASVGVQAKSAHDANKARKSALADADRKQQAAADEAAQIESTANEAAKAKAAARAKAIADSSTILTSATGVEDKATVKKQTLGGV